MAKTHVKSRREFLQMASGVLGATTFGTLLGTSADSNAAAPLAPLTIAFPSTSGAMVPLWLAYEKGLFAQNGVQAKIVQIAPNVTTTALIADQVDLVLQSPTGLLTANLNGGADLVYIGLEQNRSPYSFVVSKDIKTAADLKGKTIGTDRPGSGADYRTGAFLELLGLSTKDVKLLQLGNPDVVAAAMSSGQLAGGALVPPFTFRLEAQGFWIIAEGTNLTGADFSFGPMVRKSRIEQLTPALRGFTRAFQQALQMYLQQPELAKQILQQYSKENDPVILQKTWALYAKVFNPSLKMDLDALQSLIDYLAGNILPKAKGMKASQFIDARFLS